MSREKLFDEYPPLSREMALKACELIQQIAPDAVELVEKSYQAVTYGSGKNMRAQSCYVAVFQHHINVGFYNGIDLPDPRTLMEGTGKRLRHVKIRQADELDNPALHDLIRASLKDVMAS